jgi:hypothetical protein
MGTGNRDLYSTFLMGGTWESSGVPNIELAMMQLIHSRKETEFNAWNYRNSITLGGVYHQRIQHIQPR